MKEYRDQYKGINIQNATNDVDRLRSEKEPQSEDTKNRLDILSKISVYMKDGMSQEEAIDLVMQDEDVIKKFEYLTKSGLDIKTCFINWTNRIVRTRKYDSVIKKEDRDER